MGGPSPTATTNPTIGPVIYVEPDDPGSATPFVPTAPPDPGQPQTTPEQQTAAPPLSAVPLVSTDGMTATQLVQVLTSDFTTFDNAADRGKNNNKLSLTEFNAVANNPNANAYDRAVATYLINNPDVFSAIDTTGDGGAPDFQISSNEIAAFAQRLDSASSSSAEGAASLLSSNFSTFDTDGDGKISIPDLRTVADNPDSSEEIRSAANYVLTHPDSYKQMCPLGSDQIDSNSLAAFEVSLQSKFLAKEVIAIEKNAFATEDGKSATEDGQKGAVKR